MKKRRLQGDITNDHLPRTDPILHENGLETVSMNDAGASHRSEDGIDNLSPYSPTASSVARTARSAASRIMDTSVASPTISTRPTTGAEMSLRPDHAIESNELLIDRILADAKVSGHFEQSVVVASNDYTPSSTLAFFSESKIQTLSKILGHDNLYDILLDFDGNAASRLKAFKLRSLESLANGHLKEEDLQDAHLFIQAYFDNVHPIYPFLDRQQFQTMAANPNLKHSLANDVTWAALYYGVLCLGSLYHDGGSFKPGEGFSWRLFATALRVLPEVLLVRRTLMTAQALLVLAIYGQTFASLPIDELPITEAARIAISLGLGRRPQADELAQSRTRAFWMIYCMEKDFAFNVTRSSLISDCDVACPLPQPGRDDFPELEWLRVWAKFSRLTSKAYEHLFSLHALHQPKHVQLQRSDELLAELEGWKLSIPLSFRPGTAIKRHRLSRNVLMTLAVKIHFYYHNMRIGISRLVLQLCGNGTSPQATNSKAVLMAAARAIIELTPHVEVEPFTPGWILGHVPIVATFIIFELVVHNPRHAESKKNLAMLDMAIGYFNRFEDNGVSTPTDLRVMTNIIDLAKSYVTKVQQESDDPFGPLSHAAHDSHEMRQKANQQYRYPQTPGTTMSNMASPVSPVRTHSSHAEFPEMVMDPSLIPESIEALIYPVDDSVFLGDGFQPMMPMYVAPDLNFFGLFDHEIT